MCSCSYMFVDIVNLKNKITDIYLKNKYRLCLCLDSFILIFTEPKRIKYCCCNIFVTIPVKYLGLKLYRTCWFY
jgi:hypothetical protein